jgi:hypothetical protein
MKERIISFLGTCGILITVVALLPEMTAFSSGGGTGQPPCAVAGTGCVEDPLWDPIMTQFRNCAAPTLQIPGNCTGTDCSCTTISDNYRSFCGCTRPGDIPPHPIENNPVINPPNP